MFKDQKLEKPNKLGDQIVINKIIDTRILYIANCRCSEIYLDKTAPKWQIVLISANNIYYCRKRCLVQSEGCFLKPDHGCRGVRFLFSYGVAM